MKPEEIESSFKITLNWIDTTIKWAAQSRFRSFVILSVLSITIIWTPFWVGKKVIEDNHTAFMAKMQKTWYVQEENTYKIAIDWIDLCIDSIKSNHKYKNRYCDKAVKMFAKASVKWPIQTKDLIIDEAYEEMKIEVSNHLRSVEYQRFRDKKTAQNEIVLDVILNPMFKWFLLSFTVLVLVLLAYLLDRTRKSLRIDK